MRRSTLLSLLVLTLAAGAMAEETSIDDELGLYRTASDADRQTLIAANVALTPEEAERFWPLYHEYRREMGKAIDRLLTTVGALAAAYPEVSDERAEELLDQSLSIERQRAEIKQKYAHLFGRVLPAAKVARVMQVENKLDAFANFEFARQIPLVPAP